ncbi:hypothetical protein ACFU44_00640 [Nocardia rhizosphaerihabitans]|uniref:hypothetical protein n=1 Tax=Nocardia rhizosphaerihabitans TaxID=1691570 RepID=UPI00366AE521
MYLAKNEIAFAEINVSRNPLALEALIEQGHASVPVVEWNYEDQSGVWAGFRPEDIEALAYLIHD